MLDRTNRALLVTVLVLGALFLLRLGQHAMVDPPGFSTEGFVPADVPLMSLCEPQSCIAFARGEDGLWAFTDEGEQEPVDQHRIQQVLEAWAPGVSTSYKVAAELRGHVSPVFGTESGDTLTLRFERKEDDEILSLEVGHSAPTGGHYVQREGDRAIYVMPIPRAEFLTSDRRAWFDKSALRRGARELDSFTILNRHGALAFERQGEEWSVREPADLKVDPRALDRLLDEVGALSALLQARGEESDRAREQGFDRPRISVTTRKRGITATLHLGSETPDGSVYVDREGTKNMFIAKASTFERLDVAADQLRDRTLLSFAPSEGSTVRWANGTRSVELSFGDAWMQGSAPAPEGTTLAVASLQPLRATKAAEKPSSPPEMKLTVGGTEGFELSIWPEVDGAHPAELDGRQTSVTPRFVERFDALLN
ncbi:MAG: DUF4340 domain-containing protein [Deltaproteobacteria bacterium]|nr:DUF4340 domain-containing protein [Deltaproteobacteria bacterium]